MENKINIAELLKDCPKGMELDCTMFESLEFDSIVNDSPLPIRCRLKDPDGEGYDIYNFTKYGCWNNISSAKCVIFPKDKITWEGFVPPIRFKDGDIVISTNNNIHLISCRDKNNGWESCCGIIYDKFDSTKTAHVIPIRIATKEEKAKLFQAIKDNGYRWNAETKTLEEPIKPEFKVWDKIRLKNDKTRIETIDCIYHNSYGLCGNHLLFFKEQDEWELVPVEPKFKVGNKIVNTLRKHMGASMTQGVISEITDDKYIFIDSSYISISDQDSWELVPNKFDITTLKPFDKVLVKTDVHNPVWSIDFYGGYNIKVGGSFTPFAVTGGKYFQQCIPYKGNEHLCGTTNDCDDFYKTWEK